MKPSKEHIRLLILAAIGGGLITWVIGNYEALIPYRWLRFSTTDGEISLEFPGLPVTKDQQASTLSGGTTTLHMVETQTADGSDYLCAYSDKQKSGDKPVDDLLNSARDAGIKNVQGSLITEKKIVVQGSPSRQIEARGRGGIFLDIRLIAAGDRIYALQVVNASEKSRDNKNIRRFFESFKLGGAAEGTP